MFACPCAESKKHGDVSRTATPPTARRVQDRHAWTPADDSARLHNGNDSHPSASRQRNIGNQAMLRRLAQSSRTATQAGQTMEESAGPKKRSMCAACAKEEEGSGQRTLKLAGGAVHRQP